MRSEDRVRVKHMIEACKAALGFVAGRERAELDANLMLRFALVRAIEILGEAASKITEETRVVAVNIPWKEIVGMPNRLVHAYFEIDPNIVWAAVTVEIPELLPRLRGLTSDE